MTAPDFEGLKQSAAAKAEALTRAVTSDGRWQLEDELMCQVFGFTLFGYVFGYGRIVCFMDVDEIQRLAASQLSGLGIGPQYAEGLMEEAYKEFGTEGNQSVYNQLIGIGHSHFAADDTGDLVDSIFENTELIRSAM